jgi:hypothetical protein
MQEGLPAADPTDEALVSSNPPTVASRKQTFAQMLNVKLEQGYQVESQSDTEAVLFTPGRRQWFALFGVGVSARLAISLDEQGKATTRKLSPSG